MWILLQMTVIKLNLWLCEDKDWQTAAHDFFFITILVHEKQFAEQFEIVKV
jgi:hypothetical protein